MGKIDLDELKVKSFVTSLNEKRGGTIKGGTDICTNVGCGGTADCSEVGCNMTDDFENCGEDDPSHANSCVHACHTEIADPHCYGTLENC